VRNPKKNTIASDGCLRLATLLFYMVSEPPVMEVAALATTRAVMRVL
jgi:hypothetical protein